MTPESAIPQPTTPDFVLRFRVRTLLIVTAVVAVAAAIAAPVLRRQTPEVQQALVTFWLAVVCFSLVSVGMRLHGAFRTSPSGQARFILMLAPQWRGGPWTQWGLRVFSVGVLVAGLVLFSFSTIDECQQRQGKWELWPVILHGWMLASGVGGAVFSCVQKPIALYDKGVGLDGHIPWAWIRSAEWLPNRPRVVRLHRLDGDLLLDVPTEQRAAVEEFLREKTKFDDTSPCRSEIT